MYFIDECLGRKFNDWIGLNLPEFEKSYTNSSYNFILTGQNKCAFDGCNHKTTTTHWAWLLFFQNISTMLGSK